MAVRTDLSEPELLAVGLDRFRALLPEDWTVSPLNRGPDDSDSGAPPGESVTLVNIDPGQSGAWGRLIVEARRRVGPMDVPKVLSGQLDLLRKLAGADTHVLVVAPWLSRRTRELLEEKGYGYLDLTGNAWLVLPRPAMFVRTSGSDEDPTPGVRRKSGLSGPLAGRLVRTLADVAPPYRPAELAEATGLTRSYVSRLLETLENQALIFREGPRIEQVDWVGLLRARAERYDLLKTNESFPMISPAGADAVINRLRSETALRDSVTVTGPVAAAAVAPLSVGGQLMLYTDAPDQIAEQLGLLPTKAGADVVLLAPSDPVITARSRRVDGLCHVALSQLVLDSLSGNGRMPADGEAVLQRMRVTADEWRAPRLTG
jgi:hypothetical protein